MNGKLTQQELRIIEETKRQGEQYHGPLKKKPSRVWPIVLIWVIVCLLAAAVWSFVALFP